jgi:hypothetical protein
MPTAGEAYIVVSEYHFSSRIHRNIAPVAESRIDFARIQPFLELGDVDGNNIEPEVRRDLLDCRIGGGSWCLALYLGPETKGKPPERYCTRQYSASSRV